MIDFCVAVVLGADAKRPNTKIALTQPQDAANLCAAAANFPLQLSVTTGGGIPSDHSGAGGPRRALDRI